MTISSSSFIKNKKNKKRSRAAAEADSPNEMTTSDPQPSTSGTSSDGSPPKEARGKNKMENGLKETPKRKRKMLSASDQDEDPYMKGICDMWRLSVEKQSECFERSMELQQAAIQSQTEQTKALVAGLKDILKDCLKSD